MRLGRIGFDNVAGYLKDGMDALGDRPELVGTIERITAVALAERMGKPEAPTVVDVRSEKEWQTKRIGGSVNIPLNHLLERAGEIPDNQQVVVHCEGGYRSAIAASILAQAGRPDVFDMVGGYNAWAASRLPVEESPSLSPTPKQRIARWRITRPTDPRAASTAATAGHISFISAGTPGRQKTWDD